MVRDLNGDRNSQSVQTANKAILAGRLVPAEVYCRWLVCSGDKGEGTRVSPQMREGLPGSCRMHDCTNPVGGDTHGAFSVHPQTCTRKMSCKVLARKVFT